MPPDIGRNHRYRVNYGSNLFDLEEPADLAIFAYQCLPHSDLLQPETFGSKEDITPVIQTKRFGQDSRIWLLRKWIWRRCSFP